MISVILSSSDSTTGENTTTGYINRLFVTFCDVSQKAINITGYGPRPCGVVENALQIEQSSRDTILAILREADNHWNTTCHTDICTSPAELELVGRHNDIEQTKKLLRRKLHTNQVAESAEAQRAQEIGYVMLGHRAQNGMASLPPIHDKRSEQFEKSAHRRAVKLGKKCYQDAIMQWIDNSC